MSTDLPDEKPQGAFERTMGPLTATKLISLLLAIAFLGGSVGWAMGQRDDEPLSEVDAGFMRDMNLHHLQAIQMSLLLLKNDTVSPALQEYAQEIIMSQRFEQGIFNATLDRFGFPSDPDDVVMEWMGGPGIPPEQMSGMATDDQMNELADATGDEAESLWIALMSEHHLGGIHMADWAARHGSDEVTVEVAKGMVKNQRDEILELGRYRDRAELAFPEGFGDPRADQRMNALSLAEG